ncbi:MAG: SCP2 sterol-binding domain-containing protein [Thermoplasmata archaeon]|nr:SCP2 sterol-binding domain-containing protein [Thermoplasmata archaeon]
MDELEELLLNTIEKFKVKVKEDENLREELMDFEKSVNIEITDGEGFSFRLAKAEILDFNKGNVKDADIAVIATRDDMMALFKGELKVMKAWATKRLKVKGSMADIMRFRKFLS